MVVEFETMLNSLCHPISKFQQACRTTKPNFCQQWTAATKFNNYTFQFSFVVNCNCSSFFIFLHLFSSILINFPFFSDAFVDVACFMVLSGLH